MPTTDPAPQPTHPKPSSNNNNNIDGNDDHDDEVVEATVLDEPSVRDEHRPGAFPIAGPDGRRRNSGGRDDESLAENNLETLGPELPVRSRRRTALRNDHATSGMALVEANLVTASSPSIFDAPLVEGQMVVEQSDAERTREQRRRVVRILGLVLVVAVVAAGIAVGVTLGINSNRPSPSPSPSPLPGTSIPSFRQLFDSLPNHTAQNLRNKSSPQYLAWTWLATTEYNFDADVWQLRQRFALACFHFATNAFPSHIVNQFSILDVHECYWAGIVCNASGSVTQIALSDSALVGSVPRELYFLSELTTLNLTRNYDLEGTLSSDLQLLSNLEVFNIANAALSGSIPTELGRLSSLVLLDLSSTIITGILPTDLCQLPNLRWLNLHGTDLSGPIPTHLGNLSSSLKWLDLIGNSFTGSLPSELGHLTQLEHLVLSYNDQLTGRIPTELGLLSQLTYLNLNILSSMTGSSPVSIPTEIGQLTRLESLYLGGVNGTVPTELGLLSQLKYLELEIESTTGRLPTELGQLPLLESLEIAYSKNGTIPAEVGLMSRLTDLSMRGATGPIPTTFGRLTVLESLYFTELSLMGSIPTELGQLSALTYLSLFFKNAWTGTIPIDFLGLLSNLRDLSIYNFNGTIPTELGLLSNNLQYLSLRDSYVNGPIPTELGLLSELTYLGLSYNNDLTGTIPTELGRLTELESIYVVDASVTGNVPSEICLLANIDGGVLDTIFINCTMVNCSCGVKVCYCS